MRSIIAGAFIAGGLFGSAHTADDAQTDRAVSRGYVWNLPPGFPPPRVPANNSMSIDKVALGCRLFFDARLSVTGKYSCASCHRPELAFTDGRASAVGATGEAVRRSAMTLTNVAYNPVYTWASAARTTLETQMAAPLFGAHPVEMGLNEQDGALLDKLQNDEGYTNAFRNSFPDESESISITHVIKAIAAFERTLISGRSAFDRYVFDDDAKALSESARRGMTLFYSARIGCAQCHFGFNFSGQTAHAQTSNRKALFAKTALYNIDGKGSYPSSDRGLIEESGRHRDMGRFRVPTLRNSALTAPYMHDGSVATLAEVLQHYATGGRQAPLGPATKNRHREAKMKPFALSETERDDLIEFLNSLTDFTFVESSAYRCTPP